MIAAIALGLLASSHAATWGAYKDSPYEGFHPSRQLRTVIVAVLIACAGVGADLIDVGSGLVALGIIYTGERLATEWWKTIVREDDQTAFSIPMRLGFLGRPVDRRRVRYPVGIMVAAGAVGAGFAVNHAQDLLQPIPWWLLVLAVGGAGGWLTAFGGAWKDAPVEGFSSWKFLRSPAVATAWAVPLSFLTGHWLALLLAAGGLAVASIETYKTFLTGGRPPGKFATMPVRFQLPVTRYRVGLMHAAVWGALALLLGWLLVNPAPLSSGGAMASEAQPFASAATLAVLVVAAAMTVLVYRANTRLAGLPTLSEAESASIRFEVAQGEVASPAA